MSRRSSTTALRPCLKHSTVTTTTTTVPLDPQASAAGAPAGANSNPFPFALCPSVVGGPRVHFPPAPGLCQTHLTHSPSIYDRAPIVVLPNACALPARNERTYPPSSEYSPSPSSPTRRKHRPSSSCATIQAAQQLQQQQQQMPPLVPDLSSSESDESDGSIVPPDHMRFPSTAHPPISIVDGADSEATAAALSFLPHANEREKPRKEHRSRSRSRGSPRSSMRQSEFALPELDGCLGGF